MFGVLWIIKLGGLFNINKFLFLKMIFIFKLSLFFKGLGVILGVKSVILLFFFKVNLFFFIFFFW